MADSKYLLPHLEEGFVTVIVGTGDERKSFALHKSLVCKRSEYFRASLGGDWKESHTGQIELSEDDPKVFALYIQSLYAGNVHQANPEESRNAKYRCLGELYMLADRMIDVHAKNHVTTAVFQRLKTSVVPLGFDVCDELADMITMIWHVTSQNAPVRQLLVDSIADFRTRDCFGTKTEPLGNMDCLSKTPSEFLSLVIAALIRKHNRTFDYEAREKPEKLKLSEYLEAVQ